MGPAGLYQSSRLEDYRRAAEQLLAAGSRFAAAARAASFARAAKGCPARIPAPAANAPSRTATPRIRVRVEPRLVTRSSTDCRGRIETDLSATTGDYVIVRRDGLPAYHLAVVLDDAAQGVTTVVRGVDLLRVDGGARCICSACSVCRTPRYFHLPVVVNALRSEAVEANRRRSRSKSRRATLPARVLEPAWARRTVRRWPTSGPPRFGGGRSSAGAIDSLKGRRDDRASPRDRPGALRARHARI